MSTLVTRRPRLLATVALALTSALIALVAAASRPAATGQRVAPHDDGCNRCTIILLPPIVIIPIHPIPGFRASLADRA